MVPERSWLVVLVPTLYVTVPVPTPEAPEVIVIQETSLVAVHAHPAPALTVKLL
jgi:hypothetical protein